MHRRSKEVGTTRVLYPQNYLVHQWWKELAIRFADGFFTAQAGKITDTEK
jgi:hypothetical protein